MITRAQLETAYEQDQRRLGRKVYDVAELPVAFSDLTPQWLTGALCGDHPGAEVVEHRLVDVEQGTSNRMAVQVTYNDAGTDAGLPTRLFCKATHGLANRMTLGLSGGAEAEANFYNHVRPLLDIEAPPGLFARVDHNTLNSMVIMRDISDSVSEWCTHRTEVTRARIESHLTLLADLHGAGYSDPRVQKESARFSSWQEFFERTLVFGMREGSEQGFRRAEDLIPARLHRRHAEIWPATIASVELTNESPTLVHSDVHLKNWYVTDTGDMALCDWQCATRGHWARDFAYALGTALTVEDRRAWERDLLALYLDRLHAAGGPKLGLDEGWLAYRQQLMTALTWWTITYNPAPGMPDMQPMETSRMFVERLATAMDDVESLDSFG